MIPEVHRAIKKVIPQGNKLSRPDEAPAPK